MKRTKEPVITGIGILAPSGLGKAKFWRSLERGASLITKIETFPTRNFRTPYAGEIKQFNAAKILGPKNLRNIPRSSLLLMAAAKDAIGDAKLAITERNTDSIGVCAGTTFPHIASIVEFDREVFKEGINFSNPALFPSTVINAASSLVSIRFNIQGFSTTVSTGYTSGLEALSYSVNALKTGKAKTVLAGAVESLDSTMFFGFQKLGYMAGIRGKAICCPYDRRRNGPLFGEAAVVLIVENETDALKRGVRPLVRIRSIASYFDCRRIGGIDPQGTGLECAVRSALKETGLRPEQIDYVSGCANSSSDLDRVEARVMEKVFGGASVPVSSIKSIVGETVSAAGALQVVSVIGAMGRGRIPPTINYRNPDPKCRIDCVPNKARKKEVRKALVVSSGPGGYNCACVLEKYE